MADIKIPVAGVCAAGHQHLRLRSQTHGVRPRYRAFMFQAVKRCFRGMAKCLVDCYWQAGGL